MPEALRTMRAAAAPATQQVERQRGRAAVEARAKFLRKHPLCAMCIKRGALVPGAQVDHVIPLYKGGLDVDANKQSLCDPCHKLKTATDLGASRHPGCDISGEPIGASW